MQFLKRVHRRVHWKTSCQRMVVEKSDKICIGTTRKLTCFVRRRKETKKQSKKSIQKPPEA